MNEQLQAIKDNARIYVDDIKKEHGIDLHNLPDDAPLFARLLAQSNFCVKGLDIDYCVNLIPLVSLAASKYEGEPYEALAQSFKFDPEDWGYWDEFGGRGFIHTSIVNYVKNEGSWGFFVIHPDRTDWMELPKEVGSLLDEYREYLRTIDYRVEGSLTGSPSHTATYQ